MWGMWINNVCDQIKNATVNTSLQSVFSSWKIILLQLFQQCQEVYLHSILIMTYDVSLLHSILCISPKLCLYCIIMNTRNVSNFLRCKYNKVKYEY